MGLDAVWPLLAELAWLSPTRFEQLVHALNDMVLEHLLGRFSVDFDGSGQTDDLMWFPAWVLTEQPRLAGLFIDAQPCRHTDAERAWQLMMALLKLEREGRHHEMIEHRRRLQSLDSGLYRSYMQTR